ncbi:hypothetical protein [Ilumatobacter sp.]|uniref:hypothetical protein n=1 Tax=Ilumatobacter sp. TaxID=1967498 RepID=UPI003B517720
MIAIDILEWPGFNQAFIVSFLASVAMVVGIVLYGKRRPRGRPASWGEAMLGATYVFGMLFLTYGILPHQFIDHADKNLGWSRDMLIAGPGGILRSEAQGGWLPLTLQYEAVRDTLVVLLHAVFFGLHMWVAVWWQKRGETKQAELPTSTYGRPLVKKA